MKQPDGPPDPRSARAGERREVGGLPPAPPCPFCREAQTELMSPFGSHASVSTYWCRPCRSPFEILKWGAGTPSGATRPEPGATRPE
ncbi:MAG: hypothetical protein RQ751_10485 [Longimicrobiales bacterium]|nr:hypothetical protein [Longimicrobiales bacterium]